MIDGSSENIKNANSVFTVTELYNELGKTLAGNIAFSSIRVKGEISSIVLTDKGFLYVDLKEIGKDARGYKKNYVISCARFFGNSAELLKKYKVGDVVTVVGAIGFYEPGSKLSIKFTQIFANDEIGKAKADYEMKKKKLEALGYFDPAHHKPLPKYPMSIGIVTSATGLARYDIEEKVMERDPRVQLYLINAAVQGVNGPQEIIKGIEYFDKHSQVDIIIIGRGGGSKDDLGPFDDENVVKAVYECEKPIVTATGHAKDTTLADYAADECFRTPTDVAERLVKDVASQVEQLNNLDEQLNLKIKSIYENKEGSYRTLLAGLEKYNPEKVIDAKYTELKRLSEGLDNKINALKISLSSKLETLTKSLELNSPENKLKDYENKLILSANEINNKVINKYQSVESIYSREIGRLEALNPKLKLKGGFGYLTLNEKPVASVNDVKTGDKIKIMLHDGEIETGVLNIKKND